MPKGLYSENSANLWAKQKKNTVGGTRHCVFLQNLLYYAEVDSAGRNRFISSSWKRLADGLFLKTS